MERKINGACLLGCFLTVIACSQSPTRDRHMSRADTLAVLQTAFNEQVLVRDASLYFPGQSLKLIQNKVIKPDYSLTFNGSDVKVINIAEEGPAVGQANPGQFIISFPMFRAVHKDTVLLSMIIHAGNATDLYTMVRNGKGAWEIRADQRGKL